MHMIRKQPPHREEEGGSVRLVKRGEYSPKRGRQCGFHRRASLRLAMPHPRVISIGAGGLHQIRQPQARVYLACEAFYSWHSGVLSSALPPQKDPTSSALSWMTWAGAMSPALAGRCRHRTWTAWPKRGCSSGSSMWLLPSAPHRAVV